MRLNKFLAQGGVASRRHADELILAGRVCVNGIQVKKMGVGVDLSKDRVTLDGKIVKKEPGIIYAVYKPRGVVSTVADKHASQTIVGILPKGKRVYPVGRLDKESEGLILVTNDGELANQLMHPRFEHAKEYEVMVTGDRAAVRALERVKQINGSKIEPFTMSAPKAVGNSSWLVNLTLKEGKKRQIREMARAVGLKVMRLKRVRIGKLRLGKLVPGKWKIVTEADII